MTRDTPSPQSAAWERTREEASDIVAEHESAGWTATLVTAGHVAPETPERSDTDRPALEFVVPGEDAAAVESAVATVDFDATRVHRRAMEGWTFLVIELLATAAERAILVAGAYESRFEAPIASAARDSGTVLTVIRTLDETVAATFRHDDPSVFFPED